MKKIIFAILIMLALTGTAWSQAWGWNQAPLNTMRLEGTLQLQNGQIALNTGSAVYFVPELRQLIGFVDGLVENARVTVDAYVMGNTLRLTQLTVAGRSYDFAAQNFAQANPGFNNVPMGRNANRGHHRGFHNAWCCW